MILNYYIHFVRNLTNACHTQLTAKKIFVDDLIDHHLIKLFLIRYMAVIL